MPKLKSIFAGLAVSTAMGGGLVGLGAATTATSADAATSAGVVTSTSFQAGCFRRSRCGGWGWGNNWGGWGGGWGWRRHHNNRVGKVKVTIHNRNFNRNRVTEREVTKPTVRDHDRDHDDD
ncbi:MULTISPECIES: hypothetical protein [unclassified Nonomuraea]|uniref:hypothetical protein n=1 Tax=unclassified Nonomuraea TaxID=2593643 RepID=UPI0033E8B5FB